MPQATSEARLLCAIDAAHERYRQEMGNVCAVASLCVSPTVLRDIHERTCCELVEAFKKKKYMIDHQTLQSHADQLQQV